MKVLIFGDVVAKPGRIAVLERIQDLREQHQIDLAIMNAENLAGGFSVTPSLCEQLFANGIDVMTSGNHIFDKKEILEYIDKQPRLLRPANYSPGVPGKGRWVGKVRGVPIAVINLQGRVFMSQCDDPFRCVDAQLAALEPSVKIILVDMHAEATSEKVAMGRYLDGRASVVGGTHTHVQTADEQIMPDGTAYITDLGMVGPHDGVIGMQTEIVLERFLRGLSTKFEPCEGEIKLNGLIVDVDEETGRASRVERLSLQHS